MNRGILVFLALLSLNSPALAQLQGTDSNPGDSCTGFAAGATRMNADAGQDDAHILLICDGSVWQSANAGVGGGSSVWLNDGPSGPAEIYYNGGNVGIGTNDPAAALDTGPNPTAIAFGTGLNPTTTTSIQGSIIGRGPTSNWQLNLQDGGGRANHFWNATGSGGNYIVNGEPASRFMQSVNGTTGGSFGFFGAPAGTAGSPITWTQYMALYDQQAWLSPRGTNTDFMIDSVGNVGIGTGGPAQKLTVVGSGASVFLVDKGTAGRFGEGHDATFNITQGANVTGGGRGLTVHGYPGSTANVVEFWGNNGSGFIQALSVKNSNSFVGISHNDPQTRLDVNGSLKISDGSELCNAAVHEGAMRYVGATDKFQMCRAAGTGWEDIGTGSGGADNLGNHTATAQLNMGSQVVQFGADVGDKIKWWSHDYGTGIEPSTLTNWSYANHRWRIGGNSVSSGTQAMVLSNSIGGTGRAGLALTNPGWNTLAMDGSGSTKSLLMNYGGDTENTLRFARHADNFGGWEANPVVFDLDAPDWSFFIDGNGAMRIRNDVWHYTEDGKTRTFYSANGNNHYKVGGNGSAFVFRNADDTDKAYISGADGNIWMAWLGDWISNRIGQDVRSSASPSFGAVFANNWFRTTGTTGWFSETYGGGWHMSDTTWLRAYNSKSVYTDQTIRADNGFQVDGNDVINGSGRVATAALGTGTANSTTYLRGDGTWATVSAGLPALTSANLWIGNGSNVATAVTLSGDATMSNAGVLTIGPNAFGSAEIVDASIAGADIANTTITVGKLSASGTANNTTFLRGDGAWAVPSGGGSGITANTTASCTMTWSQNSCTVACPATYFRVGCSLSAPEPGISSGYSTAPGGANGCTCGFGTSSGRADDATCYAYCAK